MTEQAALSTRRESGGFRALLVAVGILLVAGGIIGISRPRDIVLSHPSYRRSSGALEFVSKRKARIYSILALLAGGATIAAGVLKIRLGLPYGDWAIADTIVRVQPELLKRYGRIEDCSLAQIEKTAGDLSVGAGIEPYLFAAFLGQAALANLEARMPNLNWAEIEETTQRIFDDMPHDELNGSHFHESWKGVYGA